MICENHMARQVKRVAKDTLERSKRTDNKIKKVGNGMQMSKQHEPKEFHIKMGKILRSRKI